MKNDCIINKYFKIYDWVGLLMFITSIKKYINGNVAILNNNYGVL